MINYHFWHMFQYFRQAHGLDPKLNKFWYFWHFWHFFINLQKHNLHQKWPHQWSGAVVQCSLRRISMRIFSMLTKICDFMILMILVKFWVLGPRPMGPFIFLHFLKICFMVWDLSRSVRMVFRSPGNLLIKLCHFIFN